MQNVCKYDTRMNNEFPNVWCNFMMYRYGKRTTEGILNDGWNALARYYLNNFRDGTRQV